MATPKRTLSEVAVERAVVEAAQEKEAWLCCSGSKCSQQAVRYGVSVSAAFCLMAFCVVKLSVSETPDPLFLSLLSLCTGILLPQPSISH